MGLAAARRASGTGEERPALERDPGRAGCPLRRTAYPAGAGQKLGVAAPIGVHNTQITAAIYPRGGVGLARAVGTGREV